MKFNKKFSDTMKVSIQLIKKPINFLKSITNYKKKYTSKLKYFITWHIKPKKPIKNIYNFIKNDLNSHENIHKSCKILIKMTYIQPKIYKDTCKTFKIKFKHKHRHIHTK